MKELLQDPIFFYAVAYTLFLLLVWIFGRKPVGAWMDGEIAKIREEIDEVKALRAEAEEALKEAKAKKEAVLAEAEAIIAHVKDEVVQMKADSERNLKDLLAKHEQQAIERINYLEKEATAHVKEAVINMAMQLVTETLAKKLDETALSKLTDQAIADMPKLASAKAKAA